ncbi:LuxR C-terminal-related transcriptional regulator [Bordetella genomosp. 10]|nr:LuxR C-terminal-related transcriptional regulator [Bordetella genomosp. 10]
MMSRMHVPATRPPVAYPLAHSPAYPRPSGMPDPAAAPSGPSACPGAAGHPRQADLTRRERDILPYLISGKSNKYISIELSISSRTAEAHRANILRKMGVRSTMELACRMCPHRQARE